MIIVGKISGPTMSNTIEYLQNTNGHLLKFGSKSSAKRYLQSKLSNDEEFLYADIFDENSDLYEDLVNDALGG